jgi:hypothetical protein
MHEFSRVQVQPPSPNHQSNKRQISSHPSACCRANRIFAGMALMMGQRGLTFSVNRSAGNTVRLRSLSVHNIVGADAADRLSALWPGKAYITQLRSQTMPDNHPDSQHRRWQQEMASRRGEIREKIRAYTGRRENILCPFPGMSVVELHRPMPPCACLYQPSVSLIIQGRSASVWAKKPMLIMNPTFF